MKIIFLFQLFILFVFFSSCNGAQIKKPNSVYNSEESDSIKSLHNAIYLSGKYEKAALDSLKKYNLTESADSCMKFFYVVNYMRNVRDNLWCKDNSLTVGESEVKLTGFVNMDIDEKQILFGVFLKDSIPCSIELKAHETSIAIGFTVSVKNKKATEVWVGQYTKMDFDNFKMYYDSILSSKDFKNYLHTKSSIVHPTFKRFVNEIRF